MELVSKTEIMRRVAAGQGIEAFSHETEGNFNVTAMRQWAQENRLLPVLAPLDEGFVEFIRTQRDIDLKRVAELNPLQIALDPAMALLLETGEHLLVDGSHRILRRWDMGMRDFPVWVIPIALAIRIDTVKEGAVSWGKWRIVDGKVVPNESA